MDARRSTHLNIPSLIHTLTSSQEIQKATASEPLTLEEEYSMQRSWREDADKLTFIVCTHSGEQFYNDITQKPQTQFMSPGEQDAPESMIGDVNLFLYDDDEEEDDEQTNVAEAPKRPRTVIGELEIMIARHDQRGKGMAQETLSAFISYIQTSLPELLLEYTGADSAVLKYLRVKIDKDNVRSLRLFERVGFVRVSAEPNYFGEVELRTPVVDGRLRDVEDRIGMEAFGRCVDYGV